jgi:excisionase family DNA binding protein
MSVENGAAVITRFTRYDALPSYLNVDEVCVLLAIGRSHAYEMIRRGELPSVKFGRLVRVPRTAFAPETAGEPKR